MATRTRERTQWPQARCHFTAFFGDSKPQGKLAAHVRTIAAVERHIEAEEGNDVAEIAGSVTQEPRFVVPVRDGQGSGFQIITTHEGVRRYYDDSRNIYEIVRSLHLKQIATDWYVFYESMATTRPVQTANGVRKIGGEQTGNSIVLFPTSRDAIVGEMPLSRFPGRAVPEGYAPPSRNGSPLPMAQYRNTQVHDRFVAALQRGEMAGALAPLTDDFLLAVPNHYGVGEAPFFSGSGRQQAREYLEAMGRAVDVLGITVLNRIVHDWYIFAELLWRVRHKGALFGLPATGAEFQFRTASMYLVTEDGRIAAEVGHSTSVARSLKAALRARG